MRRIVILEKKFNVHPIFTNYATSNDGEIFNVKNLKFKTLIE